MYFIHYFLAISFKDFLDFLFKEASTYFSLRYDDFRKSKQLKLRADSYKQKFLEKIT